MTQANVPTGPPARTEVTRRSSNPGRDQRATRFGRWRRTVRAFFRLPGGRGFVLLIGVFALVALVTVIDLDTRYRHPTEDGRGLGTGEAIYATFTLIFFGGAYPWPDDPLTDALFFLVPLMGLAVLGQGAARLGSAIINRDRWERAVASTHHDHIIVCGLGRLGFRMVQWLHDLGEAVVVVTSGEGPDGEFVDAVRRWRIPVVIGDARRPEVLADAGIERASAIAPITENDLANLAIATEARALRPGLRVVLRTFDDRLGASLQQGFDIHAAYSMSALAAPAFAAAALHTPVDHAFSVGEGEHRTLLTITKFTIVEGSRLAGYTIQRLEEEFDVAAIGRRAQSFELHPPPEAVLQVGDGFVVSGTPANLMRLARLTPPTRELRRYEQGRWPIET